MSNYDITKCLFKDVPPFNSSKEFQELCNNHSYYTFLLLLFTPFIYLLVLQLEKKCCKSKYKTL